MSEAKGYRPGTSVPRASKRASRSQGVRSLRFAAVSCRGSQGRGRVKRLSVKPSVALQKLQHPARNA